MGCGQEMLTDVNAAPVASPSVGELSKKRAASPKASSAPAKKASPAPAKKKGPPTKAEKAAQEAEKKIEAERKQEEKRQEKAKAFTHAALHLPVWRPPLPAPAWEGTSELSGQTCFCQLSGVGRGGMWLAWKGPSASCSSVRVLYSHVCHTHTLLLLRLWRGSSRLKRLQWARQ